MVTKAYEMVIVAILLTPTVALQLGREHFENPGQILNILRTSSPPKQSSWICHGSLLWLSRVPFDHEISALPSCHCLQQLCLAHWFILTLTALYITWLMIHLFWILSSPCTSVGILQFHHFFFFFSHIWPWPLWMILIEWFQYSAPNYIVKIST